ncbi:MAG TPA: pseudouridine synthase [Melioribacteraceae bacterium]|nr:pseudouridine synthase [Melioribacteraceae bacterium]
MSAGSILLPKKYFIIYKPYGVLSQFTDPEGRKTIKSVYNFPENVYPVGRLDMDSEGLLILTNDKMLTDYLLNPKNRHEKEYFVQVEGIPDGKTLLKLENGVVIEGKKTLPARAGMIDNPGFEPRVPPIRVRKNIPDTWISLVITEGRNRQVRKMTAAVGHPTLRLVRVRIKNLTIDGMKSGDVRELTRREIEDLKK